MADARVRERWLSKVLHKRGVFHFAATTVLPRPARAPTRLPTHLAAHLARSTHRGERRRLTGPRNVKRAPRGAFELRGVVQLGGGVDVKQGVEGRQESVREGMCGLALHPYVPVDASAARWVRGSPRSGAAPRYVARSRIGAESGRNVILGSRKHLSTDRSEPKAGNA